jgi:hypothetical protein
MLTPRGHSYRRRRGPSRALVFSVGLVVLILVAVGVWWGFRGGGEQKTAAAQRCSTVQPLKTSDVRVTVVNSTRKEGLARATGRQLAARGFTVVSTGNVGGAKNAPASAAPKTYVNYGAAGLAGAELVVANLMQGHPTQNSRNDSDVEVVIGADFKGLAPTPQVLANLAKLPRQKPTC